MSRHLYAAGLVLALALGFLLIGAIAADVVVLVF